MCQYKYTRHSCGHTLPKLEETHDPSCKLCVPVLVALKYYHDQPTQICIENTFQQPPLRMPKPCRQIGTNSLGDTEESTHTYTQDQTRFEGIMDHLGVDLAERSSILQLALRQNQTSRRDTNITVPLRPLCRRNFEFVMELETWQQRQYPPPNTTFNTVSWGCGGTVLGNCLVGWTGQGILMYRHGIWNVNPPHPSYAWSPLPVGYLYIDYGEAPVLQLPERWRASATRTLIDIPMYTCLYQVLRGRSSGPLIQDDQGNLVPALGASGPNVPPGPYFPPRHPPISSALPLPQLPISTIHMGQLRPPQALVSNARSRQRPGRRYPPPWNFSASMNQASREPKPDETHKQRINKTHKERHGKIQNEAGPSQPVDRAEISTKIKELPQRRASRSGNATPASTASAGVSQPVYSTHPTPGNTRPATPAGTVPQSDDRIVGLGIIEDLPPSASVEAINENVADTVPSQPPHHHISQPHEPSAEIPASEEKRPTKPIPSHQTSTHERSHSPHPNIKLPSPPDDIPFDLSSNILIGASPTPATLPPPPPHQLSPLQPSTQTQTSHPNPIIQNITQSTSNMTQYVNALQQAPGVTYTLNPTAEPFSPGGEGKGEA